MIPHIRGLRRLAVAIAVTAVAAAGLPALPATAASTVYEAENATLSQAGVFNNHLGYTGTGFVDYVNTTGGYVEWTVTAAAAGPQTLTLRYSNGTTTVRPMDLAVNGSVVSAGLSFGSTGNWDTWANKSVTANLVAGTNVIRATGTTSNGGPNVDSLTVGDVVTPPATDWSKAVVDSTMARFTPSTIGGWSYPVALYLQGQYQVYLRTHDARYLQYIKDWGNRFVDSSGNISNSFGSLDSMEPGNVLLILYKETGQDKWRIAAKKIRDRLTTYPRTSDGGWWHGSGSSREGQLWGDGTFMADPFAIRYGQQFNDATWGNNNAAQQLVVYAKHLQRTTGPQAGLLYHVYDEPGGATASWVHPELGNTNGITWCRAEGWYGLAITDILELLPADHPQRAQLIDILRKLVDAFARYQDPATGRWWQVVDKGTDPNNWLETSCSAMYTTTISRAIEKGYVDASYQTYADKGYHGVLAKTSIGSDGRTNVADICIGTNADDALSFYYGRPRATNDFHGLGAFLIMSEQMIKTGRA
ncbi:glycoside hydrolase family 88 protein [Planotetraspora sp. GP83]|uniref:glycoside hydrolase family 88 protein n=1 Tax=Planotetraspora sp. GP83 TaxID=3156264 RepID=UPI0035149B04